MAKHGAKHVPSAAETRQEEITAHAEGKEDDQTPEEARKRRRAIHQEVKCGIAAWSDGANDGCAGRSRDAQEVTRGHRSRLLNIGISLLASGVRREESLG